MGPVKYTSNEAYLLKGMGIDLKNISKKEWQIAKDIFDALNKLGPNPGAYRKLFAHAKILLKQDNPRFSLIQLLKKRMNQIEEKSKYEDFEIKTTALVNTNPTTFEPVTLDEAQILKIYKIIHTKDQDLAIQAQFHAKKAEELIKKIRKRHPELNDPKYLQGLKIAAFLVIYKAARDDLFDNYTIAQIFALSTQQLNKIELQFLKSIDFKLDLTKKN